MPDLGTAYVQIVPSAEGIGSSIKKAMDPEAKSAGESAGKTSGSSFAKSMGKAIAGGAAVIGASVTLAAKKTWDMTNSVAAAGDEIDKMSQKIGISASAYQEWAYVFERSGTDVNNLQAGMKTLSSVITDAANGSESAAEKLAAVGLSVEELNGLSQDQQLELVVTSLQKMGKGAKRTSAATDLLGKSATDMAAVLNMTAGETDNLRAEAYEYGMVMSDDAVAASAAFQDSLTKLNGTMSGVKTQIASSLLPGFTQVVNGFSDLVAGNDGATTAIQNGMAMILQSFTTAIPSMVSLVSTLAQSVLEAAPQIITSLATGIMQSVPLMLPVITDLVTQIVAALLTLLPQMIDVGVQILVSLIQGVTEAIPQLIEMLPTIVTTMVSTLLDNLGLIIEAGIELLRAIIEGLVEALPELIEMLPDIVATTVRVLLENLDVLVKGAFELFMGIVTGLGQMIPQLIAKLPEVVQAVISECTEPLEQLFSDLWENIKTIFSGVATWFKAKFNKAWTYIKLVFAGWGDFFSGLWTKIKDKFSDIGSALGGAISDAVKSGINGIISLIEGVINDAISIINGAIDLINYIPGVHVGKVGKVSLPRLAEGGVITQRTVAEIGEDGAEAIVPLERNTQWIRSVAAEIDQNGGSAADFAAAVKAALLGVSVDLDDHELGRFVDKQVANAIYA